MATISKVPVELTVEETEALLRVLGDYASSQWDHSRKTKSAAISEFCERQGSWARDLEGKLVRRLYVQSE